MILYVIRGGGKFRGETDCKTTTRSNYPSNYCSNYGFRLIKKLKV